MAAPDDLLYEYAVIRYVPRVEREEFLNIGLVMLNKRNKWMKGMVIADEERIKALFPEADTECLRRQSRIFEREDVPSPDLPVEEKYRWLSSVKSACLQVSPSHPGVMVRRSDDENTSTDVLMEREFQRLFSILVL